MSQARPHAAALLRKVEPSTEKGRAELSSVTGGGGPPRFPADAQTLAPLEAGVVEAGAAAAVLVVSVAVSVGATEQSVSAELSSVDDASDVVALPAETLQSGRSI